jgi:endonuclease G
MTNRHVANLFSAGLGQVIKYRASDAAVDFKRELNSPEGDQSSYVRVRSVEMIHPYWDMAILLVEGLPTDGALNLSILSPEELIGRDIVAVGYPARDYRSDLDLQDRIFHKVYNVKRLQPGKVRARAMVQSFENRVNAMTHDSSTLGGNSGSAIIDVARAEVIALHFAGEYLKANYAVPMYELARDSRVAPKLNFDGSVTATTDFDPAWRSADGTSESAAPGAIAAPASAGTGANLQSPRPPAGQTGSGFPQTATWTIPLSVSVTIGASTLAVGPEPSARPAVAAEADLAEEGIVVDQDYSNREGYDPEFLGKVRVPLPKLSEAMEAETAVVNEQFRKDGNPFELAYHRYSVYMNKSRRTAWFSAANVDGGHRPNIGRREGDRWYVDPRISKSEQLAQNAFEHGIDRGHLTRREDTVWGKSVADALAANNDTFHFTNCSLQASLFNRGKDRWQGLEQFLLEQHAKKDKRLMTVITGPLFAPNDPGYRNEKMDYTVRCPLQFWKVCVLIREDGTPSATGFILGQDEIQSLPGFEETFDVAATQIAIADLEQRTGLDFGDLDKYDHFAQGAPPGTLELPAAGGRFRLKPVREGADIVV